MSLIQLTFHICKIIPTWRNVVPCQPFEARLSTRGLGRLANEANVDSEKGPACSSTSSREGMRQNTIGTLTDLDLYKASSANIYQGDLGLA